MREPIASNESGLACVNTERHLLKEEFHAQENFSFSPELLLLFLGTVRIQARDNASEPHRFLREFVGLSDDEIRRIREGKATAKTVDSPTANQVFVFGSVYINATPELYLKFAADIRHFRFQNPWGALFNCNLLICWSLKYSGSC